MFASITWTDQATATDCSSLVLKTASNSMPWMSYETLERMSATMNYQHFLKLFPAEAIGISNIFLSSSIYVTFTHSQSYLHSVKCFMKQWTLTH